VVGHQPTLGRVADALLRPQGGRLAGLGRRPGTPLDHAGIVCLATDSGRRRRTWVAWAISYSDGAAEDDVRHKIERKTDAAKLFATVLTLGIPVVLGLLFDQQQLSDLADRKWAVQLGACFYLVSAALFLGTLFSYDSLLMPTRFWGEAPPAGGPSRFGPARLRRPRRPRRWLVERPPSSAAWVLYQNMMRIWRNLFTLAAVSAFLGTALIMFAALGVGVGVSLSVAVVGTVAVGSWLLYSRPVLGSED